MKLTKIMYVECKWGARDKREDFEHKNMNMFVTILVKRLLYREWGKRQKQQISHAYIPQ